MATPTAVDRPMKKKIRTKKRSPAGEGATAPTRSIVIPTKVVKPGFTAKLTKRGKRLVTLVSVQVQSEGEGLLSNGKHLVFRPPPSRREIDVGSKMPYNKNSAQPNGNKDCNTKYANKKARKQRLALAEVAVEELNALTIADKPLDARKNAVPTATNKDAIVCLKGKGTIVPKNDVVQK
ncbi:hypothetical protein E4U57_008083 [Claviceps arundinis]|uniref:Uncharacterized protein n=1 Tax=Claviceps arundinis TaxID=1623583 RepID=A0ABQ7P2S0_9HYPO|nr:hypothetical protein E4U57_008083 [Claviceps arundinis]